MKLPYGYVLAGEKIIVNEEKADIVRSIFEYYLAGASLGKIVSDLESGHITDPNSIGCIYSKLPLEEILLFGQVFLFLIVWKLDRFARNRYDNARYKADLKKNGVKKVIRGMTDNALKCKFNGGTKPVGYVIDEKQHFQLDPLTAPFVLETFKRYDGGATMTEIRDWLNDQGVKNTRGQPMSYNSVEHLLKNRRYIGEFRYRETVVPNGIPVIVPQDLFGRV